MALALDNSSLLSDQDTNQFWCRRRLNPRSLIQLSETLPVELTGIHIFFFEREFQPMAFAPDDSSLSSDQDTNQFLV